MELPVFAITMVSLFYFLYKYFIAWYQGESLVYLLYKHRKHLNNKKQQGKPVMYKQTNKSNTLDKVSAIWPVK